MITAEETKKLHTEQKKKDEKHYELEKLAKEGKLTPENNLTTKDIEALIKESIEQHFSETCILVKDKLKDRVINSLKKSGYTVTLIKNKYTIMKLERIKVKEGGFFSKDVYKDVQTAYISWYTYYTAILWEGKAEDISWSVFNRYETQPFSAKVEREFIEL